MIELDKINREFLEMVWLVDVKHIFISSLEHSPSPLVHKGKEGFEPPENHWKGAEKRVWKGVVFKKGLYTAIFLLQKKEHCGHLTTIID